MGQIELKEEMSLGFLATQEKIPYTVFSSCNVNAKLLKKILWLVET